MKSRNCVCKHKKELHGRPESSGTNCYAKNCLCGRFVKKGQKCNICGRIALKAKHNSKHHVLPVSIKRNNKTIILCKACHSDLHTLFTTSELAQLTFAEQRKMLLKKIYPTKSD